MKKEELKDKIRENIESAKSLQDFVLDEWATFSKKDKEKAGSVITRSQEIKESLEKIIQEI